MECAPFRPVLTDCIGEIKSDEPSDEDQKKNDIFEHKNSSVVRSVFEGEEKKKKKIIFPQVATQ